MLEVQLPGQFCWQRNRPASDRLGPGSQSGNLIFNINFRTKTYSAKITNKIKFILFIKLLRFAINQLTRFRLGPQLQALAKGYSPGARNNRRRNHCRGRNWSSSRHSLDVSNSKTICLYLIIFIPKLDIHISYVVQYKNTQKMQVFIPY